jgi:hypothetical protein
MPDGRMVAKSIAWNEPLGAVSLEADYLFGRMIPFLDAAGRISGSAKAIKAQCCPLRDEMTPDVVARCLGELDEAKLIVWYKLEGQQYVAFPNFAKHQRGAKLDREAPSRFPTYSASGALSVRTNEAIAPEQVRTNSGPTADEVRLSKEKSSKEKSSKEKRSEETSRKGRATWVTPFEFAWKDCYGGKMPIKPNTRALREAVDALGAEQALERWINYLRQTEAQYASAARFAAPLDAWKPGQTPATPVAGSVNTSVDAELYVRGRALYELAIKYNVLSYNGNASEYAQLMERLCADERAGPDIRAELAAVKFSKGIGDQNSDHFAILEIARRLKAARAMA